MSLFYLSGGFSIDWMYRQPNYNWWEDEEESTENLKKAEELFEKSKPKIVVSHECPTIIKNEVLTNLAKEDVLSRTEASLQNMFEKHQPEIWIFGHHHNKVDITMCTYGTRFIGLDELMFRKPSECIFEIPNLTWKG